MLGNDAAEYEGSDGEAEAVGVELLIGAGFLNKTAATPKSEKWAERRRQEAIETARAKFLRNVVANRQMLESVSLSDEYGAWFEAFNGERAVLDDLAALGSDPWALKFGMAWNLQEWKARATRAAAKKGLLWEMLAASKNGRERRIIRVRLATPEWVDYDKIMEVYRRRNLITKQTGVDHHVDHIVPLAGRNATGLHVHDNLQILTAAENMKKLNKFNDWA